MNVVPVAEARAGLSRLLADFRAGDDVEVVVIGAHRRPDAVLMPYRSYRALSDGRAAPPANLARLRELKSVVERLAAASRLSNVRVYGSVARGEEVEGSDVDLLVTPDEGTTLFDIAQLELDLEAVLGVPVSVMSDRALDPVRDQRILDEAVAL